MVEPPVASRRAPVPAVPVEVLAPHPVITSAYADAGQKRTFLNAIFDDTAQDYDRVERWLSLGSGKWYRRAALARAGLRHGMSVADVATGTGLVAEGALRIIGPTPPARLVGIDPSAEMMRRARERLGVETVSGTAESLPFADASFDFLSMGYALRHVEDVSSAFREFHRVVRPGGRICILEITRPRTRLGCAFLRTYLGTLSRGIGLFGKLAPRTPELWAYYWETIDKCLPPQEVLHALSSAGFIQVNRKVFGGIFSEYTATRAAAS
ncbi:MAG TPA: class I SAM-dependent methyltransferase [Phycisphaerales bacterium]|nr:class I SAM-dependent methyltransferase [Phycisphaerales bacterium]